MLKYSAQSTNVVLGSGHMHDKCPTYYTNSSYVQYILYHKYLVTEFQLKLLC